MLLNNKKALIIGETRMCLECIILLVQNNWDIVAIASEDEEIIQWSSKNSIPIISITELESIEEKSFYLFSIINPYIIPDSFLMDKNVVLALNYHDSFLPKYAGVNSTTWAIINNEKKHGITLHKIAAGIDEGDIVVNLSIDIDKDETALSLNLKCAEALLPLFQKVIKQIETGTLAFSKQCLEEGTYYGLKSLPENYGLVNGIKDLQVLHRLVRGLFLGKDYDNPVASVKIFRDGKFYLLEELNLNNEKQSFSLFNRVKDIYGNELDVKVNVKDLASNYNLTQDELIYLSTIKAKERKNKKQIIKFLNNSNASLKVIDYKGTYSKQDKPYTGEIFLPNKTANNYILALVYLVLARFFQTRFITSLYFADTDIPEKLRGLVEHRRFICINKDLLAYGFEELQNYLKQARNFHTVTKDFFYRYHLEVLTDIAIAIGEVSITDNHRINIEIANNKVIIAGKIFDQELINALTECIRVMLTNYSQNELINSDLRKISILGEAQYEQIIYEWNATDKAYPHDKTLHELFEEQAKRTPDRIAVVYEEKSLTYEELNNKANQLAHYLKQTYQIKSDNLIALCLDRSERMLIAIIAVLKSGGAYVPIDPGYPEERIAYILQDTKTKVVLTDKVHQDMLSSIINQMPGRTTTDVLALDTPVSQCLLAHQPSSNIGQLTESHNLAYTIYTSGTTGKPKGVMIEHRSVVSLITSLLTKYHITANEKFILFANYVFDASAEQINLALLSGNTLHILSSDHIKEVKFFEEYIVKHAITHLHVTPSFLENLNVLELAGLNRLIVGGEVLSEQLLSKCLSCIDKVVNEYGPTETTITSLMSFNSSTIGKPTSNTQVFILDSNQSPLPIGAVGELYIGGVQLARGYLNLPELTGEKFITNPLQTEEEKRQGKNAKLYKTGDLVRYLSDGNVEYMGRNDFQVKIRGYRIELGEIESTFSSYPEVKQAVVLAREHLLNSGAPTGTKYLVAYYVADSKLDDLALLNYLSTHLPEYMVPSAVVYLEKFPLTINGKLDHRALPEPKFISGVESYVAPRTEFEVEVCAIYAEVLNLPVDKVSATDDFFRLGGNSILAIKLVNRLKQELELKISVAAIFKFKTIAGLVKNLLSEAASDIVIPKAILCKDNEVYPLSFAQERLWFIKQYEGDSNAYNVPMLFKINKNIHLDNLKQSFLSIINRHEVLRSLIKTDSGGKGYQSIQDITINPLITPHTILSSSQELNEVLRQEANHVYELEKEFPIRLGLYTDSSDNSNYLSLVIHHIAFDGWSIDVILHELGLYYNYYQALSQGKKATLDLPTLSIQYKDFAIWQRSYLSGEHLAKELNYWSAKLKDFETLNLPLDKARPTEMDYRGLDVYFVLEEVVSIKLRTLARELKVSLYSILLSGFYLLLRSYSNQDDIVLGTPVANRNYSQLENLIGFFVNSLALRVKINPELSVIEFIKSIGHEVINAQLHQDLPFEKLVEELNVPKDTSRHPIFQVMFGVQGFGDKVLLNTHDADKVNQLLSNYELEGGYQIAKFDLTTLIDDSQSQLRGSFNYATSLFKKDTITGMINTFITLLEQFANLSTQQVDQIKVKQLSYLNQDTYQQIIYDWNWNTAKQVYPSDKTIHQLFEEQVVRTPNNIAIVYEDTQLTYTQLNEKSNQLAHYLRQTYKIKPDDLI